MKVTAGGSSFVLKGTYSEASGLNAALDACGLSLLGLCAGTGLGEDIGEEASACLILAAEATEAENRAVALLSRAEQCRALLDAKLAQRGIKAGGRRLALDALEADGLLSDRRFAEAWLHTRDLSGGPTKLLLALRAKGVDARTAQSAFDAVFDDSKRRAALELAAARELKKAGGDKDEVRSRLRALGFRGEEVRSVLYGE